MSLPNSSHQFLLWFLQLYFLFLSTFSLLFLPLFKFFFPFPSLFFFPPHINIDLHTNSPISASRNGIYKQRSKLRCFFFPNCVLGKSKYNRITTDFFIFFVTVGFISIKYMKQFSAFSLHVFIWNINWSAGLHFYMLSCSFGS